MSVVSGIAGANAAKDSAQTMSNAQSEATAAQIAASQQAAEASLMGMQMGAGATIRAAEIGAGAVKSSAKIAAETQWKMYAQSRQDQLPWLEAGGRALGKLESMMKKGPGSFRADPGYQFRLDQGNKQLTANAAATGNLASGRTLKALTEYGQDYASNEYDRFINRFYQSLTPYQSLAGLGQTTATNMGGQSIATGNAIAAGERGAGNALASIYSQQGSNLASLYQNSGNAMAQNYMNQGNALAQGYMNQGQIAASGQINATNAWTGAINSGMMSLAQYYGNSGSSAGAASSSSGWTGTDSASVPVEGW
jgi:hypothetical protein